MSDLKLNGAKRTGKARGKNSGSRKDELTLFADVPAAPPAEQQSTMTRTHRAFGLFPSALLLSGYGESEVEKQRSFEITEKNVNTDETIERRFEMFTKSEMGLPRGRDPHVLVSLLKLLFTKPEATNGVWFRKSELLDILGWSDNAENRADIDGAIQRYYDASYRGLSLQTDGKDVETKKNGSGARKVREREQVRRLIISYDRVDERRVRHFADKTGAGEETEKLFTQVVFHPDFINDLRGEELSITTDLNVLRVLNSSSMAMRLYEIINYVTNTGRLEFEFEIRELAHERLGISRSNKAPSQCWQKIGHAFEKLKKADYLLEYTYVRTNGRVVGRVNQKFAAERLTALPPLTTSENRRETLKRRFVALGAYQNAVSSAFRRLPENLLGDAQLIVDHIERTKVLGHSSGKEIKWGGWAYNELMSLVDNGFVNLDFLSEAKSQVEAATELPLEAADAEPQVAAHLGEITPTPSLPPPLSWSSLEIVDDEAAELWLQVKAQLGKYLSKQIMEQWFATGYLSAVSLTERKLVLRAATEVVRAWVTNNYLEQLNQALKAISKNEPHREIELLIE